MIVIVTCSALQLVSYRASYLQKLVISKAKYESILFDATEFYLISRTITKTVFPVIVSHNWISDLKQKKTSSAKILFPTVVVVAAKNCDFRQDNPQRNFSTIVSTNF